MFRSNVLVCGGTGCTSSNSEKIIEKLKEEISAKGLDQEVNVVRTGCFGLVRTRPIMIVYPRARSIAASPRKMSRKLLKSTCSRDVSFAACSTKRRSSTKALQNPLTRPRSTQSRCVSHCATAA